MVLLEGLSTLEDRNPKVVFDWRRIFAFYTMETSIGPPMLDCPLLRLPSWMQLEIAIDFNPDWPMKDVLEKWLDEFCPNDQMRDRIVVREMKWDFWWLI